MKANWDRSEGSYTCPKPNKASHIFLNDLARIPRQGCFSVACQSLISRNRRKSKSKFNVVWPYKFRDVFTPRLLRSANYLIFVTLKHRTTRQSRTAEAQSNRHRFCVRDPAGISLFVTSEIFFGSATLRCMSKWIVGWVWEMT